MTASSPARAPTSCVDTARYWASRVTIERRRAGTLRGVIGPDEYHEVVDDNAFTNVMARWNLRRGADLADELRSTGRGGALAATGEQRWSTAGTPIAGLYEQFAGYWASRAAADRSASPHPPVAADVLLGARSGARLAAASSRPMSCMLHHLVPDEVEPGSLATNLAFYEPRTAHGSSLSPAIHAALLARAGEPGRGTRAVPHGRPARPRRSHRHDRRRSASRHDGRALAGAGVRVLRAPSRRRRVAHRPEACRASGRRSPCTSCSVASQSSSAPNTIASSSTVRRH